MRPIHLLDIMSTQEFHSREGEVTASRVNKKRKFTSKLWDYIGRAWEDAVVTKNSMKCSHVFSVNKSTGVLTKHLRKYGNFIEDDNQDRFSVSGSINSSVTSLLKERQHKLDKQLRVLYMFYNTDTK